MTEQHKIKIADPAHLINLGRLYGAIELSQLLEEAEKGPLGKLPGMATARALIDRERAEKRAAMVGTNMKLAAKHGVDLTVNNLLVDIDGYLIVEPLDLVERADD